MTKRRIYVVDDEEPIRRSTRLMLAVQGYDVTPFDSGAAFVQTAPALRPGTVLLDIRMPGMDGIEVQRALNAAASPHPIVVMTGHGDLSVAIEALRAGAVAFLDKPFSRAALEQALRAAFTKLEDPARYESERAGARATVERLGDGERMLLAGLARGDSNASLANLLGTTTQMVDARRAKLFAELEVESMSEALVLAFAAGFGPSNEDQDPS
jgi:two-component system response regulator FixJ